MPITFSYRMVAAVAGAAIAVGAQALAAPAGAASPGRPAGAAAGADVTGIAAQAAAVRYWTRARMAATLRAADGQPAAQEAAAARPAARVAPTARPGPAAKPASHARQLVRKPAPAPPGTWLSGDTGGQGLGWTHGGAVAGAVGKVFFTLGGADYVCSGTLVGGKHPDMVLTAAHCVTAGPAPAGPGKASAAPASTGKASTGQASTGKASTGQERWATNWIFVPGFRDGLMPYGEYTARQFFAIPGWTGPKGGSEQYDVAFVQVTAAARDGRAGTAKPPSGLPVEFARSQEQAPPGRAYVFGYPAEQPYAGLNLDYCAGPAAASGGSVRTPCAMTAGDSGGPWLAGFRPRAGSGKVAAVSTYKVAGDLRVLYGAVLGPQAEALYQRAVRSAR